MYACKSRFPSITKPKVPLLTARKFSGPGHMAYIVCQTVNGLIRLATLLIRTLHTGFTYPNVAHQIPNIVVVRLVTGFLYRSAICTRDAECSAVFLSFFLFFLIFRFFFLSFSLFSLSPPPPPHSVFPLSFYLSLFIKCTNHVILG